MCFVLCKVFIRYLCVFKDLLKSLGCVKSVSNRWQGAPVSGCALLLGQGGKLALVGGSGMNMAGDLPPMSNCSPHFFVIVLVCFACCYCCCGY